MEEFFRLLNKFGWIRFIPIIIIVTLMSWLAIFAVMTSNEQSISYKSFDSTKVEALVIGTTRDTSEVANLSKFNYYILDLEYDIDGQTYTSVFNYKGKIEDEIPSSMTVYVDNDNYEVNCAKAIFGVKTTYLMIPSFVLSAALITYISIKMIRTRNF